MYLEEENREEQSTDFASWAELFNSFLFIKTLTTYILYAAWEILSFVLMD